MKTRSGLLVVFALGWLVADARVAHGLGAQKYLNPRFAELTRDHKEIAILPFKVAIDLKHMPKNTTVDMIHQSERDEGLEFQRLLYSRLLQKSAAEGYTVAFQDVDQTNALLAKAGLTPDSLSTHTKDEIAKALGVEGLVSGSVHQSQPTSTGVAIAQTLLVGFSGSTQRVDINMSIHNGADGSLLWSYDHNDHGGLMNSVEGMVKSLLKKVAGNFPYKKTP
jgi:hypothetical protein